MQETKQPRAEQPCTQQPGAKQPVPPHRNQKQRHAAVKRTATARAALQPPRHPRQHPRAPPRRRSKPPTAPRAATPPHRVCAREGCRREDAGRTRVPALWRHAESHGGIDSALSFRRTRLLGHGPGARHRSLTLVGNRCGLLPCHRSPQGEWVQSAHRSPRRGESFAPVTTEGIGCGTKFPRTGHHKGGWVRYMPFVRFAKHLPLRCAAGGKGHALLSTKSLHPCTVAHFYARPLRPARSSAPRGSAPTARLPAAPPGSLSRPCLPTGLPSLPSPAAP